MTLLHTIHDKMKTVSRWFGRIGALLILAMMALISYDVFLRYILNDPMLGAHELVEYMLLMCFFLFLTDCWNASTHVRMGIVYERMTGGARKAADVFVGAAGALLFGFMAFKIWEELLYALEAGQVSSELLMPIWPFKIVALICLVLFVAQLLLSMAIPPESKKHGAHND
ncbi:MAG: Tripartite ATP-independent periplasmic transporter [Syntrophaceae bacterium PtaB.Bin038]|nr:MAG: Tripartite ATP-independent periplasmic transporter [Syntrophaceae bacterium PtaB.Bin038]